jgi:hypothetical protein
VKSDREFGRKRSVIAASLGCMIPSRDLAPAITDLAVRSLVCDG